MIFAVQPSPIMDANAVHIDIYLNKAGYFPNTQRPGRVRTLLSRRAAKMCLALLQTCGSHSDTGFDARTTRSTPLHNLRRPLISGIIRTTEADYSELVTNLSSKMAATECSDECKLLDLG